MFGFSAFARGEKCAGREHLRVDDHRNAEVVGDLCASCVVAVALAASEYRNAQSIASIDTREDTSSPPSYRISIS